MYRKLNLAQAQFIRHPSVDMEPVGALAEGIRSNPAGVLRRLDLTKNQFKTLYTQTIKQAMPKGGVLIT